MPRKSLFLLAFLLSCAAPPEPPPTRCSVWLSPLPAHGEAVLELVYRDTSYCWRERDVPRSDAQTHTGWR